MKLSNLVYLAITCASVSGAVITSSGYKVPEDLLTYLDCPIGDTPCKNEKKALCLDSLSFNICKNGNAENLESLLVDSGAVLEDYTPTEYCKIQNQVCNMIENYNPPLTRDYIFDVENYLTCDEDDNSCKESKNATCRLVTKMCWGNYPKTSCRKLSQTCDKIGYVEPAVEEN